MDFEESPEDQAFRAEAYEFLADHAELKPTDRPVHFLAQSDGRDEQADFEHAKESRAWQALLFENGWAGITWPKEWGGRGGTQAQARIFAEEQAKFDVAVGPFKVAETMVGPTIMAHGAEKQQKRYLPTIINGQEIWCQLFSEPGAGSDLAGLTTKAERDGDEWVVTGQKVWSSGAHYSDWGILVVRTDWDVPKHKGLTYFLVDMQSSGIEVRPLAQINGAAHFNEVFLNEVRIPDENMLGEVNQGWGVILTTLQHERQMIGGGTTIKWPDILRHALAQNAQGDPLLRQDLARAYTRYELAKWMGWRIRSDKNAAMKVGQLVKLFMSQHMARIGDLVVGMENGDGALMYEDAPDDGFWQQNFLTQWAMRIGGGTDDIQRNVIGERVLGLPGDIRVDKGVAFKELPRN